MEIENYIFPDDGKAPCRKCGKKHRSSYSSEFRECRCCCANLERRDGGVYCEVCRPVIDMYERAKRIDEAREGLIEVCYVEDGTKPEIRDDGGRGYSYFCKWRVRPGDIVRVPPNWLKGSQDAMVVSTYSNYAGSVSEITSVLRSAY